ncbi:hypothetical protein CY34DRAFT_800468 [Suillus luteus UH-Slu-Lm8-n1]|jgi:hypothetical protein|uniref:Uncharacterized protein n=1 Tax=Suillus luteus UH-Slu-Lm8-n1 TaxID=930992 RepID=A0A0D0B9R6_9AGAM|nr:hypothetical protein CY34DRAFT_800468 [Suillus luteus UH-Slu-Lm8-n1]
MTVVILRVNFEAMKPSPLKRGTPVKLGRRRLQIVVHLPKEVRQPEEPGSPNNNAWLRDLFQT